MGGDDWIKDGWDGCDMYYGPDFYPSDDNIDEDTSEAFYYEDGHIEYYSSVKELNE